MPAIACGITFVMFRAFKALEPMEFHDGFQVFIFFPFFFFFFFSSCLRQKTKTNKKQGEHRKTQSPHLHFLGLIFNRLNSLCVNEILFHEEEERRVIALEKSIDLAYTLRKVMGEKRGKREKKKRKVVRY